jgi:hypothetical protein
MDANSADTTYIIADGASISPPSGFAINATSDVANRSFVINGHLGGNTGLELGNDYTQPSGIHITVGTTGLINAVVDGIHSQCDGAVIMNNGKIESSWGIEAYGNDLSIENTGTISAGTYGLNIASNNAQVKNSGDIDGGAGIGVSINSYMGGSSTFVNSGNVSGGAYGVLTYYGDDTFINKGTVTGKVDLYMGDDTYDGKNGVVHGIIDGSYGNDHLKGGSHSDCLSGGTEHDVLIGRGGADHFIFSTDFDHDTITDFDVSGTGHDRVDLADMKGFGSFGDLKGHMHQDGADAVLDFGNGDVLTLNNVDFHDLSKADFQF